MFRWLCTTALAATTAGFAAAPAHASEWEVGVSGFYHLGLALSDGNNQSGVGVFRDGEFHFDGRLVTDQGLVFFATVEVEAQTDSEDQIDKNFGGVRTPYGSFKFGGDDTAIATFHNGIIEAPGSQIGYYDAEFITTAADDMGALAGGEQAVGFHYDTPEFRGFQAGFSYLPNLGADGAADSNSPVFESGEFLSIAAAYNGEIQGVGVGISGGYADEDGPNNDVYNIGGYVSFSGFTLAGGYQDGAADYVDGASAGETFYVGAEYSTGPWTFAGGYSNNDFNDTDVAAAWVTYNLVPGLSTTAGIEYGDDGTNEDIGGILYLSMFF
ncbi:MAG: porin [Pseudomonadota bacterium]